MQSLESIRKIVRQRLEELGAPVEEAMSEACLLQDNAYCGRRFVLGDYQAVWFIEENQLKLFGPAGELLESDRLDRQSTMAPAFAKAA